MPVDFDSYIERFNKALQAVSREAVQKVADLLAEARHRQSMVFLIGNGGSGAAASHACEDLAKGTLRDFERQRRLRALSLTDNTPAILAWANDEGYERVFVEQLRTYARPGDLLIAISGSGNSPNVLEAVRWANRNGLKTIGVTGYDGGKLYREAQVQLHVPVNDMGIAEAVHGVLFHYLVADLVERFAGEDGLAAQS